MRTCCEWYAGDCTGRLFCTTDCGATWDLSSTLVGAPVTIEFATQTIGYLATYNPAYIYRTIDGGATWSQIEDGRNVIDEANSLWHDIAVCRHDPNTFVATGRIGDATTSACTGNILCPHTCDVAGDDAGLLVSGQVC